MTSTNQFLSSLTINGVALATILFLMTVLSPRLPSIYAGRLRFAKHPPPKMSSKWFGWISAGLQTSDSDLIKSAGLDAYFFLRVVRLGLILFSIATLVGCAGILPLNLTGLRNQHTFEAASISNVKDGSPRLWGHLAGLYLLSAFVIYMVQEEFVHFIGLRHRHFRADALRSFTVLITNIPPDVTTTDQVADKFRAMFPATFHSATLATDTSALRAAVQKRSSALDSLRASTVQKRASGSAPTVASSPAFLCFSSREDAVAHWTARLDVAQRAVDSARSAPGSPATAAFVSFRSRADAHAAAQCLIDVDELYWRVEMAPNPKSVVWENVELPPTRRASQTAVAALLFVIITCFYTIPVASVSALTTLDNVEKVLPFLKPLISQDAAVRSAIEGYLPTVVLAGFMAVLPMVAEWLTYMQGAHSLAKIQTGVLNKMFFFQMFNVLLVSVIADSFFDSAKEVLDKPASLFTKLGRTMPEYSTFFINYVMLQGLTIAPLELLRISRAASALFFARSAITPRQIDDALDPQDYWSGYGMGAALSSILLVFAVGFVYAVIAPLVLPLCTLYFATTYVVYRYNVLYAYRPKFESGGMLFTSAANRILVGLAVAQLTAVGIFALKGSPAQSALAAPLPVLTALAVAGLQTRFWRASTHLPRGAGTAVAAAAAVAADEEAAGDSPSRPVMQRQSSSAAVAAAEAEDSDEGEEEEGEGGEAAGSTAAGRPRVRTLSTDHDAASRVATGTTSLARAGGASAYQPPEALEACEDVSLEDDDLDGAVALYRKRLSGAVGVWDIVRGSVKLDANGQPVFEEDDDSDDDSSSASGSDLREGGSGDPLLASEHT